MARHNIIFLIAALPEIFLLLASSVERSATVSDRGNIELNSSARGSHLESARDHVRIIREHHNAQVASTGRPDTRIGDTSLIGTCQLVRDEPKRFEACVRLYTDAGGGMATLFGSACHSMSLGENLIVQTGDVGRDLEALSPFFSTEAKIHYLADELNAVGHCSYATRRVGFGCGAVAEEALEKGRIIGLAGVITKPDLLGIELHVTPWIGAMVNHCQEPNVRLVNGSEIGHRPGEIWIQAHKDIRPGEELTADYEAESRRFQNLISKPDRAWTCADNPSLFGWLSRLAR